MAPNFARELPSIAMPLSVAFQPNEIWRHVQADILGSSLAILVHRGNRRLTEDKGCEAASQPFPFRIGKIRGKAVWSTNHHLSWEHP